MGGIVMAKKKYKCSYCGSENVVEIVYGYPVNEVFEEAEAGKVIIGGCCFAPSSPNRVCKDCKKEWKQ